jgi:transposase
VFLDETSKDGRSALRKYAWSSRGTPAIVELPFSRGKRVSALAAFNSKGFLAWEFTTDTFTRHSFHEAIVSKVLPCLNRWPLPNSIVIIDNARIHMYKEFQDAIESRGAILFFLPPYSPQLNPIEVGFALVKKWVQKHANLAFHHAPEEVLDTAFRSCASKDSVALNLFSSCGYGPKLCDAKFDMQPK